MSFLTIIALYLLVHYSAFSMAERGKSNKVFNVRLLYFAVLQQFYKSLVSDILSFLLILLLALSLLLRIFLPIWHLLTVALWWTKCEWGIEWISGTYLKNSMQLQTYF